MGYREKWFNHNKSLLGLYICSKCGRICGKSTIEIDHKIPKRYGGTDDLWNLQPLCRSCNRKKGAKKNTTEYFSAKSLAFLHGGYGKLSSSMNKQSWRDLFGLPYYRNGRKPKKRSAFSKWLNPPRKRRTRKKSAFSRWLNPPKKRRKKHWWQ